MFGDKIKKPSGGDEEAKQQEQQQLQVLQNTIDQLMGDPPVVDSRAVFDGSDTKDGASNSRAAITAKERHFIKKPLNATERKKNEKERKARQLRRLRKWLMPKNAIVALHELQGPGMAEFTVNTNGHETKAEIVINNIKYEATAPNKNLAKAKASEKALRDLAFSQMIRVKQQRAALAQQRQQQSVADGGNATGTDSGTDKLDGSDVEMETDDRVGTEDLPMEHLAAFALHKLFAEWEAEGFEVPYPKPGRAKVTATPPGTENGASGAVVSSILPKVTKTVADLPADAALRHPTTLFAYMRPQIAYEDLGLNSDQANKEFIAGLKVDGHNFVGKGRSKKLARKAAAIDACKTLFGVEFDKSVLMNG
uniref:DRBM domain-containing protein n=1 Tax=Anopheles dirus TaxID=7168 RepID=A0A182N408_9DIPT